MIYRTLIFDFDGTIADTLEETRRLYNLMAADYGLRPVAEDEIDDMRHFTLKELIKHLKIPSRRVPTLLARGTSLMRGNIDALQLIPGMDEVLRQLRPHADSLGILTSNATANVEAFLEKYHLRREFDFISTTSKLTSKARHLKSLRRQYGLKPREILYIGDELRDVKASQKADIPVAAVSWGFNSHEALAAQKPTYLFDSPHQLLSLLNAE
ncbi:MAG: HAD hydrolase-like protein [Luteolibacter sp.]